MGPYSTLPPESGTASSSTPSLPDLNKIFARQIASGFPPELAFDLVLHELVVRAASATHASAAALALARGREMICRAATGLHAPDLGVPLNTQEGLSGACLRTRQPQLCVDAESDPLVDSAAARRLGIRSILIVPVIDENVILGVLEVFSAEPAAFSKEDEALLETLARDCTRLHRAVLEARMRPSAELIPLDAPADEPGDGPALEPSQPESVPSRLYEGWMLALGALAVLAAVGVSFMIGSRFGWLRASAPPQVHVSSPASVPSETPGTAPSLSSAQPSRGSTPSTTGSKAGRSDELVVYDHGKVVFRMKQAPQSGKSVVPAAENSRLSEPITWLSPPQAEKRLHTRVEPIYPAAALEAHRSGDVVLQVLVAEDGSVASVQTLSGDSLLAAAAADAVRNWHYEPYRRNQRPTKFQTDVTLRFSLPQ